MSFRNIPPVADIFPHLHHFLDLFREVLSPKEAERVFSFQSGIFPTDTGTLKQIFEKCLHFLEDRAAEVGFRDDLLGLQRGLYREMEYLYSLDPGDPRHHFLIVIPVADRPSMLRNCVESLIGQCEDFGYGGTSIVDGKRVFRKVSLFIVDDSAEEENRLRIRETVSEATLKGVNAFYVGVDEQADIVEDADELAGEASRRLTGGRKEGALSHKGASVTRNLAYLYLNAFIRGRPEEEKFLIYFLDSDEEFGVKVRVAGAGRDIRFINYFYWLDRIFSTSEIQVLTGKVVGDPPVSPSVMVNTFLDDVLLFLETVSQVGRGAACPFHYDKGTGSFSAGYHDMVELFGYERPDAVSYECPLSGDHTREDCFSAFSQRVLDFFHGLHPTRIQYYNHAGGFTRIEKARTVYTGNYIFTPEALKYFIPFADLRLRMAGPTMGRILKSLIGEKFASVNMPLLHRRTNPDNSRVFRSGISGTEGSVDLSGEFLRQFWGDVMLFSVESLTRSGFPRRRPDLSEITSVVRSVKDDIWRLYRKQKADATTKAAALRERLLQTGNWWNQDGRMRNAVKSIELLCSIVGDNFGEDSRSMMSLSAQTDNGEYTDHLIRAIHYFHEDESVWEKLIGADILFSPAQK